jgi:putative flippase GtrA
VRRDVLDGLLADVRDESWFFDTELLVLAQRRGLRIHEVPVDWVDDPDSRVEIVRTALDDLRGVARLLVASQVARFMGIGVLSTLAYALLYLALRSPLGAGVANALVLALTAVANTAANRRFTFGLTSGALLVLHGLDADPARLVEVAVLVVSSLAATVTRFVALRTWVFARGSGDAAPSMLPAHAE